MGLAEGGGAIVGIGIVVVFVERTVAVPVGYESEFTVPYEASWSRWD